MLPTGFRTFHFVSFLYVIFFFFSFSFVSFLFSLFCFCFFAFRFFFVSFRYFSPCFLFVFFLSVSFRFFSFFFRFSVYRYPPSHDDVKPNKQTSHMHLRENSKSAPTKRRTILGGNAARMKNGNLYRETGSVNNYLITVN